MVIVNLKEGLGNQIFQYCFSLYLETHCQFDCSFFSSNFSRRLELLNFDTVKIEIAKKNDTFLQNKERVYIKDSFDYLPKVDLDENKIYIFDGYWQNRKYLEKNKEVIQNIFGVTDTNKAQILKKFPILSEKCISLHVRRSDYINLQKHYNVLSLEYYKKALDLLPKNIPIIVFSDDIEWCKSNIKYNNVHYLNNSPKLDLQAMSLCTYNITANSTFSFWGAYLNTNKEKIVVTPKNWLTKEYSLFLSNNKTENIAENIIIEDWLKI